MCGYRQRRRLRMGAATARMLSQAGAKVAIFDMDITNAEKLQKKLMALLCNAMYRAQTVLKLQYKSQCAAGIARICVNCAGMLKDDALLTRVAPCR